jgi:hypothetical protein
MTRLDLVVWCTVDNRGIDLASSAKIPVILMGFSMTHDLAKMKLTETAKGMLNYQLDATPIRGMNELAETLISFVLYKKRRAIRLGC